MSVGMMSGVGACLGAAAGAAFERVVVENIGYLTTSSSAERLLLCIGSGAVIGALTGSALHVMRKTVSVAMNVMANGAVAGAVSMFTGAIPVSCSLEWASRETDQESLSRFLVRFGKISLIPTIVGGLLGGAVAVTVTSLMQSCGNMIEHRQKTQ